MPDNDVRRFQLSVPDSVLSVAKENKSEGGCIMGSNGFTSSVEDRHFEDYEHGSVHEFGLITMTQAEIVAFGKQFDPQLFHTDPESAKSTIYGGLIASGWHTASLMMREVVRYYLPRAASLGSPGVDELRWFLPVRPGDRLTVRMTVLEATRSRSKPDRGIVVSLFEVLDQDRKVAMSAKGVNFILCRSPQSSEPVS